MKNHPIQDGLIICVIIGIFIVFYLEPEAILGIGMILAIIALPWIVGIIYQKVFKRKVR